MVAHSRVEGHDDTALSTSSSSSSSSSFSGVREPDRSAQHQRNPPEVLLTPVSTHFPPFRCNEDFLLITRTASMLELSGFYWGPLGVEEAHSRLQDAAVGTFLIRDSRQKDVFFTLSYRAASGPVSVRILYKRQKFSLAGSERFFPCLFSLLEHYVNSPKKSLSLPYRKQRLTLQELCRKRIIEVCGGGEKVEQIPVNPVLKNFLLEFPYRI
ncbi:suppressor of cytokine signaling 1a [Osmerus eperlanus]|uniref:suppressor of cytokine signaling 1a n=1 Tax=Osmerus eperlanus TaxID=29151 RepID=UPI002E1259EA